MVWFSMLFDGNTPDGQKRVMIDTDDASLVVEVHLGDRWITETSGRAANLRQLSEWLSDAIGYSFAVTLLTQWEIPSDSPLWTLNHKGGETHWTER